MLRLKYFLDINRLVLLAANRKIPLRFIYICAPEIDKQSHSGQWGNKAKRHGNTYVKALQ